MKFSEAAEEVIRLADARRAYWDEELPKRYPDYPLIRTGESRPPPPPQDAELRRLLSRPSDEVVYKLILTMYLGRDDFGATFLEEHYADMKATFPEAHIAASQMAGKVPLGDYLRDGMARLKDAGIDLDSLPLETAVAQQ